MYLCFNLFKSMNGLKILEFLILVKSARAYFSDMFPDLHRAYVFNQVTALVLVGMCTHAVMHVGRQWPIA